MNASIKKTLKGCLITFSIVFILIVVTIKGCSAYSRHKVEKDGKEQSVICDTIPYITEQPEIILSGFYDKEIDTIRFRILRNKQFISDTLVACEFIYKSASSAYKAMKIPYTYFLKTDTIVAITKNGLHYYISGYRHYAYLHYGMLGYVGSSDCRFSESCIVNGSPCNYHGELNRYKGWTNPEKRPVRIYKDTPEFTAFEKNMPIKYEDAYNLFVKKANHYSPFFLYCENGYYIFGKNKEDGSPEGIYNLYKINAKTGEVVFAENFPDNDK